MVQVKDFRCRDDSIGIFKSLKRRSFNSVDDLTKEDVFTDNISTGEYSVNGALYWSMAFSHIDSETTNYVGDMLRKMVDDIQFYRRNGVTCSLNESRMVFQYVYNKTQIAIRDKKSLDEQERELFKNCEIINLGSTESRDYTCFGWVAEQLCEKFDVWRVADADEFRLNFGEFLDWYVSIYNTVMSMTDYSRGQIYEFELEWARQHSFSDKSMMKFASSYVGKLFTHCKVN